MGTVHHKMLEGGLDVLSRVTEDYESLSAGEHPGGAGAERSVSTVSNGTLVIKFGGTSVGGGAAFVRAARIAAGAARERPTAVVVSAMAGTTDALLGFARTTVDASSRTSTGATREGAVAELHRSLAERHLEAARVAVSEEHLPEVEERLLLLLKQLVETIEEPGGDPAARRDAVASFGERLSAEVLAGALRSLGVPSAVAQDPIATDARFGEAEVLVTATRERCTRRVIPLLESDAVAVVPGYVGRSPDGAVTTLGRGGSDLSATVLGRALGAFEVWIMSDVDGVLSADPRLVPGARLIPHLSYQEAALFARLGAKVLHPRTMEPVSETGIEVLVRNTFDLESPGTRVSDLGSGPGLRCAALRRDIAFEIPCTSGHQAKAAAVICIGAHEDGHLSRGMRSLRDSNVPILHAGIAAAGPVFIVNEEAAERALRVLHATLVSSDSAEVVA